MKDKGHHPRSVQKKILREARKGTNGGSFKSPVLTSVNDFPRPYEKKIVQNPNI